VEPPSLRFYKQVHRAHIALYNALSDLASERHDVHNGPASRRATVRVIAFNSSSAGISDSCQLEQSISRVRHQLSLVPEDLLAVKVHFYRRIKTYFQLNDVESI
jgi:hypothetical protein